MGIFSAPQQAYVPPLPAAPPAPPTPVSADAVTAAQNTKSALAAAGGYGSTITTSGQGATGTAPVQNKTLLGQ